MKDMLLLWPADYDLVHTLSDLPNCGVLITDDAISQCFDDYAGVLLVTHLQTWTPNPDGGRTSHHTGKVEGFDLDGFSSCSHPDVVLLGEYLTSKHKTPVMERPYEDVAKECEDFLRRCGWVEMESCEIEGPDGRTIYFQQV